MKARSCNCLGLILTYINHCNCPFCVELHWHELHQPNLKVKQNKLTQQGGILQFVTYPQDSSLCPILDQKKNFAPFFWGAIGTLLKCVIHAKILGKLVQRPLEALGDPHNQSKASKLTKNGIQSQNTPNTDPPQRVYDFWPSLKMVHP